MRAYCVQETHCVGFARACVAVNEDQTIFALVDGLVEELGATDFENLRTAYALVENVVVAVDLVVCRLTLDLYLSAVQVSHV